MDDTYSNIMARLMPLYEMAPERFMAFYDAVYLICVDLPEGCRFRISDRCREKDLELFRDIVKTLISEQPYDKHTGQLELSDDMEYVQRTTGFKPSGNRFTPKQKRE
ncbi:hypothetical protein [Bacteroides eggerthii]|jgi:hypothetical protein|uniref:hypothetical protein n=1 Tax=Bacteroides eggerthii TaxID=28111 RepID=UPI001C21251C|nr:hypothetical protein [Bacteroides eggerthii]MBU8972971.1 hypothetical protein [Bacteroides eggerthii]MBU8997893.1 hypothetical protein [Bacteroides eggerthii]MCG4759359.1 hypothetical protein [Bacteroides eggerthii]